MMKTIIFSGAFCRVIRVENGGKARFLVEQPDGFDAMNTPRWGNVTLGRMDDVLNELGTALDAKPATVTPATKERPRK